MGNRDTDPAQSGEAESQVWGDGLSAGIQEPQTPTPYHLTNFKNLSREGATRSRKARCHLWALLSPVHNAEPG